MQGCGAQGPGRGTEGAKMPRRDRARFGGWGSVREWGKVEKRGRGTDRALVTQGLVGSSGI